MWLSLRHKRTIRKLGWRIGAAAVVVLIITAPGGEPQPASIDPAAIMPISSLVLQWHAPAIAGIAAAIGAYLWFERKRLTRE